MRSLSEAKSEDFNRKINKRFDKAEAFEENISRSGSHDTLVERSSVLPKSPSYIKDKKSGLSATGGNYISSKSYHHIKINSHSPLLHRMGV